MHCFLPKAILSPKQTTAILHLDAIRRKASKIEIKSNRSKTVVVPDGHVRQVRRLLFEREYAVADKRQDIVMLARLMTLTILFNTLYSSFSVYFYIYNHL